MGIAATDRLPLGRRALSEWLEDLFMSASEQYQPDSHELIIPEDLDWVRTKPSDLGTLEWSTMRYEAIAADEAHRCLDELLDIGFRMDRRWPEYRELTQTFKMNDAEFEERYFPVLTEEIETLIIPYIQRWGVLSDFEVLDVSDQPSGKLHSVQSANSVDPAYVIDLVFEVTSIVRILCKTEFDEVATDADLWSLRSCDPNRPPAFARQELTEWTETATSGQQLDSRKQVRDSIELTDRRQQELWHSERQLGRELDIQRRILTISLRQFIEHPKIYFRWDDSGRSIEMRGVGTRDVITHALTALFASTELGIAVCSICGRNYRPADDRRPRRGTGRYCSKECKKEGKRASNRASWHRNKHLWRGKGSGNA